MIRAAADRIEPHVRWTPVFTCSFFDEVFRAEIFFKCENFQKTGSFKARGAFNAVFSLPDDQAQRGVVAASSGNHGQALAYAASVRGIHAWIVMPRDVEETKRAATAGYGGEIVLCEPTLEARAQTAADVCQRTGATYVDSHDAPAIIAGQGTAALELITEVDRLDFVVTPVGGGGLLSGTAVAVTEASPGSLVVGAEPRAADDAYRSFTSGVWVPSENPHTIADGLRTSLGREHAFPIIKERVHTIVTVSEEAIAEHLVLMWQRMKVVIEPSSAVAVAALHEFDVWGRRVGVVLSGGNVATPF